MNAQTQEEAFDLEGLGQRLRGLREQLGLTQEEVARQLGVSRAVVSYYESGQRRPALSTLVSLARTYGVSTRELLEGEIPPAQQAPAEILFRAAPTELPDVPKTAVRVFLRFVDDFCALVDELGGKLNGPGRSPFPGALSGSKGDGARWARELREFLRLGEGPVRDLFGLLDEDVLVFRLPMGSDLKTAPSGLFYNHPQAGFCVVINSDTTLGRQHFTLAHELAHVYFHSQSDDASISMPGSPVGRERFADGFAAEFLVPADALHKLVAELSDWERNLADPVAVVHLQRHFGVSYAALLRRLLHTRLISQDTYNELCGYSPSRLALALGYEVHPADLGDYRIGPLERFPDRMLRLVRTAVHQGAITEGDAAETLDVSREAIKRLLAQPHADTSELQAIEALDEVALS
jgi:Zn-dependent peptidase ImmA (M78 family)/transcriptional regulator with XRE-family HTH domain